jgi:hypothetical protein
LRFFQAVKKEAVEGGLSLKVIEEDFVPLEMEAPGHLWSGYYTSRPGFKKLIRELSKQAYISLSQYSLCLLAQVEFKTVWESAIIEL